MNALSLEYWAEQLDNAGHGEKGTIREEACRTLGLSKDALYRRFKSLGWQSGKAKRSDAGSTSMDEDAVNIMVSLLSLSKRANGKRTMNVPVATSILAANGYDTLSPSQISRVLATYNANITKLDAVEPHKQLRSLGPNHVHQVDPSYCLLYYPPGRRKGVMQHYADQDEFYANKPENLEKIKHFKLWRYVMTDHWSGMIRVYYYQAAGETTANLFEFLMWCWRGQEGSVFSGPCDYLYWDKGSANKAKAIKKLLNSLNVKYEEHKAKNARAKGSVEKANDIVETQFESRLLIEPVNSVDEINEAVWAWQEAYNADKIKGQNCKHSRHKMARQEAWLMIYKPEYRHRLRKLPDDKICRLLLTKEGETRVVTGDLTIPYLHPITKCSLKYELSTLEHICVGMKVSVSPIIVGDSPDLLVGVKSPMGDVVYHQVAPVEFDAAGFRVDAPVFGENYASHADTPTQTAIKSADRLAYPNMSDEEIEKAKKAKKVPFNGKLVAHSHLKDVEHETRITPRGEAIEADSPVAKQIAQAPKRKGKVLDEIDLRIIVAERLGRALRPTEVEWLQSLVVVETELNNVLEQLHNGIAETPVYKLAR
ncbi:transposase family protein [Pseudoalteromonas sp. JBTF-M23]|uniref:Transposase family protein n=1 Tax=Pseudoalteromonas caenipelagi TaxID=2726988 RepID=A0A849VL32_9GAMM|nr:DDE-type integrase/transposase/recombinase [Pseudoalteromonas caenipelagi]NOU53133.1 transposase family protein [Pseudoalteromonas caenipelagi]